MVVLDARPRVLLLRARGDGEVGQRAQARQGFAAEPERRQSEQVVEHADLGRGVLLRQALVVLGRHAGAVVHHLDALRAVLLDVAVQVVFESKSFL